MMQRESLPIAKIFVPIARQATLNSKTVDEIAESILQIGQQTPIPVRRDGVNQLRPPAPTDLQVLLLAPTLKLSIFGRTTGPLRLSLRAHVSDFLSKFDEPGTGHDLVRQLPRAHRSERIFQ